MYFFSIIIPSYNRLHTLPATIESVMRQTFTDFEIIVADDGSSDGTDRWVREQKDDRIKYINQANAGVCAARNLGAGIAQGTYLIFLDSDDRVTPEWLSDFKQTLDATDADVVFCKRIINGHTTDGTGYQGFLAGTFTIRKTLFDRVGQYDASIRFGENTELKWRLMQAKAVIHFLNKANVIYDVGANGGGTNRENRIRFYYHIQQKHRAYFKNNRRELQNLCQVAGVDCFVLKRKKEALRLLWSGYWMHPVHIPSLFRSIYYTLRSMLSS